MQRMLDVLDDQALDKENESLEAFYASVRLRAEGIDNAEGKQKIIADLYERFFKLAFAKTAESLGIVYTPVQIVDFIIRSVDDALRSEFDASLSDEGVHVLDPFTGTGTFIVRLLQSGLIRHEDLARKYAQELHANEILLLAYYIAAINIEATYHGIAGGDYDPFAGIVLTDTFQIHEADDSMDEHMFPQNNERVANQKALDIRVVIGNPPYSAGQTSANDANANLKYPTLDAAIERTYAARSTATNKNSLYDSYIRAIRWASDRVGNEGIVCYVSNGSYIDSNTADGLRKTLAEEFSTIYCFNFRGNARTSGELRKKEAGNIFGGGSRSAVAILLLVKHPDPTDACRIFYHDIGDYLSREEKLAVVAKIALDDIDWQPVKPNSNGDWVNQRDAAFATFSAIGQKSPKALPKGSTIFHTFSAGLQTNRDVWVYNYSQSMVKKSSARLIDNYNDIVSEFVIFCQNKKATPRTQVETFLNPSTGPWSEPSRISWSRSLKARLAKRERIAFDPEALTIGSYRPFSRQSVYFSRHLNHERAQLPRMFIPPNYRNLGFYITGPGSDKPFAALMTNIIPDLAFWGSSSGQYFPRHTYLRMTSELGLYNDENVGEYTGVDNVTDEILIDYRTTYGDSVSKDDIFFYVYGILHSPQYRTQFAADLKKMLPRIPKVRDFHSFAEVGRKLSELHVNYDAVEPYPLQETMSAPNKLDHTELYRVEKMAFGRGAGRAKDRTQINYNSHLSLSGVPEEAYRYVLGSRSAIEWIIDRYRVTTDKASGIVNDPNDWAIEHDNPRYIVDLLKRVVTVSLETMKIVDNLPEIEIVGAP
jgi:predicted helicase